VWSSSALCFSRCLPAPLVAFTWSLTASGLVVVWLMAMGAWSNHHRSTFPTGVYDRVQPLRVTGCRHVVRQERKHFHSYYVLHDDRSTTFACMATKI
jgi:hypothetical protein